MRRGLRSLGAGKSQRIVSAASFAVVAGLLVILAIKAPGVKSLSADFNDGGVWVTRKDQSIARLNSQIDQFDRVDDVPGLSDVYQAGNTVLVDGTSNLSQVAVVPGTEAVAQFGRKSLKTAFGKTTVGLLDRSSGKAWVLPLESLGTFSPRTKATVRDAEGGAIVVSPDGRAYVLRPSKDDVVEVSLTGTRADVGDSVGLAGLPRSASPQLTVVGSTPVALMSDHQLYRPGTSPLTVPASTKLQLPSSEDETVDADALYLASRGALYRTGLGGGKLQRVSAGHSGSPAAPAQLGHCVHAAWAEKTGKAYVRAGCGAEFHAPIAGVKRSADLRFRINRDVIVLNDTSSGTVWTLKHPPVRVTDWDNTKSDSTTSKPTEQELAKPTQGGPPIANDDEFGARPGSVTILPVLLNDTDPDVGDVVTIDPDSVKLGGTGGYSDDDVAVVGNGTELQLHVPPGAGPASITYFDTDLQGNRSEAPGKVTVNVTGGGADAPPEIYPLLKRFGPQRESITVAAGHSTSKYVLHNWYDPEGDEVSLNGVANSPELRAAGLNVSTRADGTVSVVASARARSASAVLDVTDDRGASNKKESVGIEVEPEGQAPLDLLSDHVVGRPGVPIVVRPLVNDRSPDGTPLKLVDASQPSGVTVTPDFGNGSFTVVAPKARTRPYDITYRASNGVSNGTAHVRVDVIDPAKGTNLPPVAAKDVAWVRPGGTAVVDALANDTDPNGDVLVIKSVDVPAGSNVKAQLHENRQLVLQAAGKLAHAVDVGYTVSDGRGGESSSVVTVIPVPNSSEHAPVARDDSVIVRSGAVATIDVLANDSDPDGDQLSIDPMALQPDEAFRSWKAGGGVIFTAGRMLKVRAPRVKDHDGEFHAIYGVTDSQGMAASATVKLIVRADDSTNDDPDPNPVEARAVEGQVTRIPLNLAKADPDGDALAASSIVTPPRIGQILGFGLDWVTYDPVTAGQDHFAVEVGDGHGGHGIVDVSVGVANRYANASPQALSDEITVKKGEDVDYDVLANDSDADGDPLKLKGIVAPKGVSAKAMPDGTIAVKAPKTDGQSTAIGYTIVDGRGGSSSATLTVVTDANAPTYVPVTADDVVDVHKLFGKKPGDKVSVDVLKNDSDLDSSRSSLKLHSVDPGSSVSGHKLVVAVGKLDRVVAYRITDRDDNESYGLAYVAGTENLPPTLKPAAKVPGGALPAVWKVGRSQHIDLAKWVDVRSGHRPHLVEVITSESARWTRSAIKDNSVTITPVKDGADHVDLKVADGPSSDEHRLVSVISIPITIVPKNDAAPSVVGTTLQVAPGRGTSVDLSNLATAANPDHQDHLHYSLASEKVGWLSAGVKNGRLTVSASRRAKSVDSAVLRYAASDGGAKSTFATIHVLVVDDPKPPVSAPTRVVLDDATVRKPETVDLAKQAASPLTSPRYRATAKSLPGKVTVTSSGGTVRLTPLVYGSFTVPFALTDGPGRPASVGEILISAADAPGQPGRPRISNIQSHSVVATWAPAPDNGAPIDYYTVKGSLGGEAKCAATTCVVEGLRPKEQPYTFTVTAHNRKGDGPPSAASAGVQVNAIPDIMEAPTVVVAPTPTGTAMDQKLTLKWTPPRDEGTAITGYDIQYNGTVTSIENKTETTITGLTNGTAYSFQIRARNASTSEPQRFSSGSTPVAPFGKPFAPGSVTAVATNTSGEGGSVDLSWDPSDPNGDPQNLSYVVTGGPGDIPVSDGTSTSITGLTNGRTYTFRVYAVNRAGDGQATSAAGVIPWATPSAVTGLSTQDTGKTGEVKVSFGEADFKGASKDGYEIKSTGGQRMTVPSAGNGISFTGLSDNPQTITVTPLATDPNNPGTAANGVPTPHDASPYGPPGKPTPSSRNDSSTTVTFSWQTSSAANGRPISGVKYRIDGGSTQSGGPSGSTSPKGDGYNQSYTFEVWAISAGLEGEHVTITGKTPAPPDPVVNLYYDGSKPCLTDTSGVKQCEDGIHITAKNIPPGSYTVTIHNSSGGTLSGTSGKAIISQDGTWDSGNGWSNACGNTSLQFYVTVGSYSSNRVNYHACHG